MPQMRPAQFELDYSHPLAKGLVFAGLGANAGSTRYQDSSVFGKSCSLSNMEPNTDWVNLNGRRGLYFGGTDESVIIPQSARSAWSSSAFTLMYIFRYASGSYPYVFGYRRGLSNQIRHDRDAVILYNASTQYTRVNGITYSPGVIYHEAVVVANDLMAVYHNGVSVGTFGQQATPASVDMSLANEFEIGRGYHDGSYMIGEVADFCVWNRAISATEIRQLADPSNVMLSGMLKPIGDLSHSRSPYNWEGVR